MASRYPTIWCGDHNLVTNPQLDRVPPRCYNDSYAKDVKDLIEIFGMTDTCRLKYPNTKIFTFHRSGAKSRIDTILVSDNCDVKNYHQTDFSFTDHDLIEVNFQYKASWVPGRGFGKTTLQFLVRSHLLMNSEYFGME